jgi:hypothetical protein
MTNTFRKDSDTSLAIDTITTVTRKYSDLVAQRDGMIAAHESELKSYNENLAYLNNLIAQADALGIKA